MNDPDSFEMFGRNYIIQETNMSYIHIAVTF